MATIIERNGRFLARVRRRGHAPVSQTFHRRSDAMAWGRQVEADMESGRWRASGTLQAAPILRQAVAQYQDGPLQRLKGSATYAYWLAEIALLPMATKPVDKVAPADIAAWRDDMLGTLKPGTVARKLGLLSGLYTWAQKDCGWLASNPVHQVRKPKVHDARDRTVHPDELAFLQRAANGGRAPWLADALALLQTSAMRRGEVWSLKVTDVDFDSATAHLSNTKNGSSRDVPLCPEAMAALRRLHDVAQEAGRSTLIPLASAHGISLAFRRALTTARALYESACHDAGTFPDKHFLRDLRLHDFRHHAVSEWAATGALSVLELMAISGHKTPRMLARYTHLSTAALASKLASLKVDGKTAAVASPAPR